METRTIEFGVGLFMLAGIAALVMLAFQVSNVTGLTNADDSYTLVASFDNIGGLKVRSPVKVGGVLVGRVSTIELNGELTPVVKMAINRRYSNFSSESSASIQTAGLLGEQYIALTPGGDEVILKDGDRLRDTQSALVLEELIGKFLFNNESKKAL